MCSGIFGQQASGEHAVEAADVAGELGESEIDQAMELAHSVVEVLPEAVAVADQLAECLGDLIVQTSGSRPFLESQAREALSVYRVGLGALEASVLKAAGQERIQQGDVMPSRGQCGE